MELSKNFDHSGAEKKWYNHWLSKNYFHSEPDGREPYTIVIPPPNVTGVLHMGHCLNNTIQDILIRRARMQGKNACWVPGTDHASIATEAKVVHMLRERGIAKSSLSRDEFLKYAWEWKEEYGGIILQQLKKMGCSCDWERTSFTMDPHYYESVISVFIDLYNKGYIYRGKRMINWDPRAKTALSDEEVIRRETRQTLYYLKYEIVGETQETEDRRPRTEETEDRRPMTEDLGLETADRGLETGDWGLGTGDWRLETEKETDYITIATVRPETIMGDTAVCVHPDDERYKHLHGKYVLVPLINRRIPVITDEYVTMDFGTGALKVTPAHDMNDNQLGQKHGLEVVDIFNEDGTLNEAAQIYVGEDRFEARKKIAKELEEKGYLVKTEDYTSEVGYSERTDVVVEPRLSLQWWVDMKKIYTPALKAVMDEEIKFYPPKFRNLYRHWMENIKDWCISRQLWWGHRIPAWYDENGNVYVAPDEKTAIQSAVSSRQSAVSSPQSPVGSRQSAVDSSQSAVPSRQSPVPSPQPGDKGKKDGIDVPTGDRRLETEDRRLETEIRLTQDEDCLDTWFSSWLWPFEVFKGYSDPGNKDIRYYYPTNTLVTAPEIIFFWVARMIMAGYEYKKEKPFSEVYFTGIVRDKQGRKMSKSLGNSPDLLKLIDDDGADAVRFGIMIASPAGNDLMWDPAGNEQGRFFINKIWNALKLVKLWEDGRRKTEDGEKTEDGRRKTEEGRPETDSFFAVNWFAGRLNEVRVQLDEQFREFRLSEALKSIYSLVWDDFCSWYLEWVKPPYGEPMDAEVYEKTVDYFEQLMQLLHPFLPFITEEVYHQLREREDDLVVKQLAPLETPDASLLESGNLLKEVITAIRDARNKNQLKPKDKIRLHIQTDNEKDYRAFEKILAKQVNAESLSYTKENAPNSITVVVQKDKFFLESTMVLDTSSQKNQLQKDLDYLKGFLVSVEKKLSNERFVQNAKAEVIEIERKKKADAEEKIRILEESLNQLR